MSKKVSIIVPVYNAEKTLKRCLDSIANQTYNNIEVIVVNDGSKDSSEGICQAYTQKDERVRLINQENVGVSKTRNNALKRVSGEYVTFVDSDDWIDERFVELLMNAIEKDQSQMAICGYFSVNDSEKTPHVFGKECVYSFGEFETFVKMSSEMLLATPWGKLFDVKYINNSFREDISLGEDVCFVLEYLRGIEDLSIVNMPLYSYDISGNMQSLSKKYHPNLCQVVRAVDETKTKLFRVKYSGCQDAEIYRMESLVDDVLIMLGKLRRQKTIPYEKLKMDYAEIFDYLQSVKPIILTGNHKLIIYYLMYKTGILKAFYKL